VRSNGGTTKRSLSKIPTEQYQQRVRKRKVGPVIHKMKMLLMLQTNEVFQILQPEARMPVANSVMEGEK